MEVQNVYTSKFNKFSFSLMVKYNHGYEGCFSRKALKMNRNGRWVFKLYPIKLSRVILFHNQNVLLKVSKNLQGWLRLLIVNLYPLISRQNAWQTYNWKYSVFPVPTDPQSTGLRLEIIVPTSLPGHRSPSWHTRTELAVSHKYCSSTWAL
jgi:hypothetical protein